MRVVITGGCGFLGRRVALRLLERSEVDELVLFDNAPFALPPPEDPRLRLVTGDIADRETVVRVVTPGTNSVFHLAAVVSGEAEADTDLGYRVNLEGTRAVLDACRALGTCPRLVFASSLAVYGGALPPSVGDDTPLTPQTSYGTQKAIGELLVNDYSRKGFVDGRAVLADRRRAAWPAEPRRLDLCFLDDPRTLVGAGGRVSDLARHGHGASLAALRRRRTAARPRSARRRIRSEPLVAAPGVFGRSRRDGGCGSPRRRRPGLHEDPLGAQPADPTHHLRLASGAHRPARGRPRLHRRQWHR